MAAADPVVLDDKLKAARLALEGPERAAKREKREHNEELHKKRGEAERRLESIKQEKEKLELAWIALDEKRVHIRQTLMPLLEEEKKIEAEESELEERERINVVAKERQAIEKERYEVQKRRRAAEEKKWQIEESLTDTEEEVDIHTKAYQKLLDEEEQLYSILESLDTPKP